MRIWFALAQPRNIFSGTYRLVSSLAGELTRKGHTVRVIWSAKRGGSIARFLFSLRLLFTLLLSFFRRPHWIVTPSSEGLFCAWAARLGLVSTRTAVRSLGWEEMSFEIERRLPRSVVPHPTPLASHLAAAAMLRTALLRTDACICGSIGEARWLKRRYPKLAGAIKVVPTGCDHAPKPFWPSQAEWPMSFLVVGEFTWKKNIDYAIELFSRLSQVLPEARLFCVGSGSIPENRRKIIDGLGDAIFIVEHELPHKMFRWYETCPFLIAASRYEGGHPLPVLEAQSRGMVVFANTIPAVGEIVRDGHDGILLTGCAAEADAARIAAVCNDRERCTAIGLAAWRSASRKSWERQTRRLIRVLSAK
jgi:glycosyltransferase involved in cell wall biosynthesis